MLYLRICTGRLNIIYVFFLRTHHLPSQLPRDHQETMTNAPPGHVEIGALATLERGRCPPKKHSKVRNHSTIRLTSHLCIYSFPCSASFVALLRRSHPMLHQGKTFVKLKVQWKSHKLCVSNLTNFLHIRALSETLPLCCLIHYHFNVFNNNTYM